MRWPSFTLRTRLTMLGVVVAVVAVAATAVAVQRLTEADFRSSVQRDLDVELLVRDEIAFYGALQGDWDGVESTVQVLAEDFGQRIALATLDGVIIADSEQLLFGRDAPLPAQATIVDPGSSLTPFSVPEGDLDQIELDNSVVFACLEGAGVEAEFIDSSFGFETVVPARPMTEAESIAVFDCVDGAVEGLFFDPFTFEDFSASGRFGIPSEFDEFGEFGESDEFGGSGVFEFDEFGNLIRFDEFGNPIQVDEFGNPLGFDEFEESGLFDEFGNPLGFDEFEESGLFDEFGDPIGFDEFEESGLFDEFGDPIEFDEFGEPAPTDDRGQFLSSVEPLQLFIGYGDEGGSGLFPSGLSGRFWLAVTAVIAGTVVAATIMARRLTRPIGLLTAASHQMSSGDMSARVEVTGSDEIAQLGLAFNQMASSVQAEDKARKTLTTNVAHELRSPLANLRGYLEAIQDGVVEPDEDTIASLHEEATILETLVNDLQQLSLAAAGQLTLQRVPTDLGDLVERTVSAHGASAAKAEVEISAVTVEGVTLNVDGDRIRQVLANLLANAIRHTPPGGTVTASLSVDSDAGAATVEITDTGEGIAPQHLPFVFDRFYRADASRSRVTGGAGLGLAIAQELISAHDGTISVKSTLGTGTTFCISLPTTDPLT